MRHSGATIVLLTNLFIPCFAALSTMDTDEAVAKIDAMVEKKKASAAETKDLIDALKDPAANIRVKERAAWALGELEIKSAAPTLLEASKHKGLLVRSAALQALSRLRSATAFSRFVEIANNDPILSLRQDATLALGLLQTNKAINPLVKLSEDPAPEIQGAAALAMAATHSKKNDFSEVLQEMAASENEYIRERAKAGYDVAKRKSAAVMDQLSSADADIRLFAALYFRQFGTSKELKDLQKHHSSEADEAVRSQLAKSIAAVKKRAADAAKAKAAAAKPKEPKKTK